MANGKNTFVCSDIDCYVATLGPQQLDHEMDYYRGRSSMSSYGLGNWFVTLFHSALSLAKKISHRLSRILRPLHYLVGALGRILKIVFQKILGLAHDPSASD